MNLKINKESVKSSEKLCGSTQEQPIELDYVLPDYYPEIFRIVKCCAEPEITSCAVNSDRVTYELTVKLKVIYCPEGSSSPEAVDQKLVYSRTVNLDRPCGSPSVYISAVSDHINCRAVNRRRIDIRGAVTVSITVMGETETEIVSEVFGGNIQMKKKTCTCPSQVIKVQKRVTVSDEFDLGDDAPPVGSIIRAAAEIISADKKIISGKAAAKGELRISMAYTPSDGSADCAVKVMQFSLPFSQLVDLEGLDDTYDCRVSSSVVSCDIIPRSEGDGSSRKVECEVLLLIDCTAVRMSAYEIACDEYSTSFASSHTSVPVRIEKEPLPLESMITVKGVCENKDSPLSVIYDAWCSTAGLRIIINDGKPAAVGKVTLTVMGQAENGDFVICETDVPIEENDLIPVKGLSAEADIRASLSAVSCSYMFASGNTAEIKAEIALRGTITDFDSVEAITDISVDETEPRQTNGEYALRLYFAESGEDLWSIAKRYGASLLRITEENEIEGDTVKDGRMLLIPAAN